MLLQLTDLFVQVKLILAALLEVLFSDPRGSPQHWLEPFPKVIVKAIRRPGALRAGG